MTEKRFWCLNGYEGETSVIVDGKFAPTNGWLCNKLNELNEEKEQLKKTVNNQQIEIDYLAHLNSEFKEENKGLKLDNKILIEMVQGYQKWSEKRSEFL